MINEEQATIVIENIIEIESTNQYMMFMERFGTSKLLEKHLP